MPYKILFLLLALFSTSSYSDGPKLNFKDLEGCYKTIELNGQTIEMGDDRKRSLSKIETIKNSSFVSIENEPLHSPLITLFSGQDGMWYSYLPFVPFLEVGSTIQDKNSIHYSVDEDLFLVNQGIKKKVDHYLDLKIRKTKQETLEGSAFFESKRRELTLKASFVLKRTACE